MNATKGGNKPLQTGVVETTYVETHLDTVLNFYVEGFKPIGKRVINHEAFVDPAKRRTIFRLTTETCETKPEQTLEERLKENLDELAKQGVKVIRCCEGGGPEDLVGTVVLTIMAMKGKRA